MLKVDEEEGMLQSRSLAFILNGDPAKIATP